MSKPDNHIVGILSEFSTWCLCDDDSCEKSRNFDMAVRQIEDFYRNKIPKKINWTMGEQKQFSTKVEDSVFYQAGYNACVDTITAQFNSKEDKE